MQGEEPLQLDFGITLIGAAGADEALWHLGHRFEAACVHST